MAVSRITPWLKCITLLASLTWFTALPPTARAGIPATACIGDCNGDRTVGINELIRGVTIVLGSAALDQCAVLDCNGDGVATVACLVRAVNAALDGCPETVSVPTIEPLTGGSGFPFIAATTFDLTQVGYSQVEYVMAGTAVAFINDGPLGVDGMWSAMPGETAAYRTRILVHRPLDAERFNGAVIVEWLNVSGGLDAAPDWILAHTELIRAGYAWVGVSAQRVGVEGGDSILGIPTLALKTVDPVRYGTLAHPGDSFSYDIFSQAGQAVRQPAGANPLGDLAVDRVIAAGESQSAFRLVTYVNAVHRYANVYDGFLVHSRGAIGAPLSQAPQPAIDVPGAAMIRSDLTEPVLTFETETDLIALSYVGARQPDTDRFRLWEVAGTANVDTYTTPVGPTDLGDSPDVAGLFITTMAIPLPGFECPLPVNSGPQHWVLKAALSALDRWVRDGTLPPPAPRLDVADGPPAAIRRDANGNALGGIRTPQVDVPIATLSGEGQVGSIICLLFGITVPFDEATVAALYPSHDAYVSAFDAATDVAVEAGFILPPDAELMKAHAAASDIGG
jgi:hypothetical protein